MSQVAVRIASTAESSTSRGRAGIGHAVPGAGPPPRRVALTAGGPDNYVKPVGFPDPLNKPSQIWWAEVEAGPMGIEKHLTDCLLWWPAAESSVPVKDLRVSVDVLKDLHARDFYRGTADERLAYSGAIDVFAALRSRVCEASQKEKESWNLSI